MIQGYGDCLGQIGVRVCPGELSGIGSCDLRDTREKVDEELDELEEALTQNNRARAEEELGDLLFTVAQLARHLDIEPEGALRAATRKFTQRVEHIEKQLEDQEIDWEQVADVEALWAQAKES